MSKDYFEKPLSQIERRYRGLLARRNRKLKGGSGVVDRYAYPVLTAAHIPPQWRYDLNPQTNPWCLERMGVNSVFNAGAIEIDGLIHLVPRVEGVDRKSFFAVAVSKSGIDRFRFWDYPIQIAPACEEETNIYDMRLTRHVDGWIYGVFCAERHDPARPNDPSAALARTGIARTKDLKTWYRLPDLQAPGSQHRNYVLHPEFVDGKYAFYTRPMEDFKQTGSSPGIGWGLCEDIERPRIDKEVLIDPCIYHTISEGKNGLGPAPIKTEKGWLQLAHGVRQTAAGYRYVLYLFLTDLNEPWRVIYKPGGYLMAPEGRERVGDVSNVLFCNGWVARADGTVLIYYGASDTRLHVATSTIDKLLDYVINTPPDGLTWYRSVQQRCELISANRALEGEQGAKDK